MPRALDGARPEWNTYFGFAYERVNPLGGTDAPALFLRAINNREEEHVSIPVHFIPQARKNPETPLSEDKIARCDIPLETLTIVLLKWTSR